MRELLFRTITFTILTMRTSLGYLRIVLLLVGSLLVASPVFAQFRPGVTPTVAEEKPASTLEAMSGHGDDFFSRLFDPSRLTSHQTYSMSYMTGGGSSFGLTSFTNSFNYRASDDLFISADVSAVYSPFSSFGSAFQKSINGIYLSSARLDWKMGENTFLRVEYNGAPFLNSRFDDPFYNRYLFAR